MNKKFKVILFAVIALITVLLVTSCGDDSPYALFDETGYQVSVKYDANGGFFTAGTSVIVDTYGLNSLPTKDGEKIAKLVTPDDEVRGAGNSFIPSKNGYTFVGWYATRNEIEGADGKTAYTYGDRWDFENDRLHLDPNGEYTAETPVLTLYAAWIPEFRFEFYSIDDPTVLLDDCKVSPNASIDMPAWDKSKGSIKMYEFPKIDGRTFEAVYTDPEGTNKLTGNKIQHSGVLNYENASATDTVMKLYIETIEGEWQHIFNATQLKNISLDGNYIIENDIDLEGKTRNWASYLVSGKFTGKLIGKTQENGEQVKIKNVSFYQATGAAIYTTGMFGQIGDGAVIENIAFENATMTIDTGAPLRSDVSFGLLAGTIAEGATLKNVSVSGNINIDSACRFQGGYSIGLVCGSGSAQGIDYSGITCTPVGDKADSLVITVVDDKVTLDLTAIQ